MRCEWIQRGRDFYSDQSGRFDLMFSRALGLWVAIDWHSGVKVRGETREGCELWVRRQLREERSK